MKMMYGGTQVRGLNVNKFDVSTNDCTAIPSDLQSGVTCVSKGKKITGTGKSFEFANYGFLSTNSRRYVPSYINIIEVSSSEYPIKLSLDLISMRNVDFSTEQLIGTVSVDGVEYDLKASVQSNMLKVACDKTINLQVFYGKDNYV